MPAKKQPGLLPGEYMMRNLVEVWPQGLESELTQDGLEVRPEFWIAALRRKPNGDWVAEVYKGGEEVHWVIPHEVFERLVQYRDRIISKQRSDRGKERAIAESDAEPVDLEDYVRRNGTH